MDFVRTPRDRSARALIAMLMIGAPVHTLIVRYPRNTLTSGRRKNETQTAKSATPTLRTRIRRLCNMPYRLLPRAVSGDESSILLFRSLLPMRHEIMPDGPQRLTDRAVRDPEQGCHPPGVS